MHHTILRTRPLNQSFKWPSIPSYAKRNTPLHDRRTWFSIVHSIFIINDTISIYINVSHITCHHGSSFILYRIIQKLSGIPEQSIIQKCPVTHSYGYMRSSFIRVRQRHRIISLFILFPQFIIKCKIRSNTIWNLTYIILPYQWKFSTSTSESIIRHYLRQTRNIKISTVTHIVTQSRIITIHWIYQITSSSAEEIIYSTRETIIQESKISS